MEDAKGVLRVGKDLMMELINIYWAAFLLGDDEMKADREVVWDIVRQARLALVFVDDSLQYDVKILNIVSKQFDRDNITYRDVVLEAVRESGWVLQYCGNMMRCDKEIILEAAKTWEYVFDNIDPELLIDREVMLEAVKYWHNNEWWDRCLFVNDIDLMMETIKYNTVLIKIWKSNYALTLEAIKKWKYKLEYVDKSFLSQPEFMLEALKIIEGPIYTLANNLSVNEEFIFEIFKSNCSIITFAKNNAGNKEFLLRLVKQTGDMNFGLRSKMHKYDIWWPLFLAPDEK